MMQWRILLKKEMIGSWRDKKWLWIPLVFILLTIMDPITTYYLPQILETVGGLPEDTVIEFPSITGVDAIMMSLAQLSSLGVLVIALVSMGTIAGERKSGEAELILAKPVSPLSYIMSKWVALLLIVGTAYVIGMLASWYYVGILYEFIPVVDFLLLLFFYGLWLALVTAFSIFYNAICKTPGLVAFLTIGSILLMSVVSMIFSQNVLWSPNNLSGHIHSALVTGEITSDLYGTAGITILLIIVLLSLAVYSFKKKEQAA